MVGFLSHEYCCHPAFSGKFYFCTSFCGLKRRWWYDLANIRVCCSFGHDIPNGGIGAYFYKSGVVSVYEFLERRFDSSTRILLSFVFQVSRAFGTGVMIYTVAIILESVMEIPMWQSIILIGIVTMIYSLQGGMKAVVYGDMIQMIILFIGIIICFGFGLHYLGGWSNFIDNVDTSRITAVDFSSLGFNGDEFGFWPMLVGGFFLYVSYYGTDQSQVQRLLSASSLKTMRQTLVCNGLMRFPITFAYCIMGLVIGTFALSQTDFISNSWG